MAKTLKSCLQILLKLVNSTIGIVGISMIIYSMWMARVWQRHMEGSSDDFFRFSVLWFILGFLGIGITLVAITSFGHIAAHTTNAHCLSYYMVAIFFLLLVETALVADIILNSDWEEDFPEDPTGRFDDFKDFVKSNFNTCQWIGLFMVLAQGCSIVLATVLRTLEKDQARYCESDEDNTAPSLPFLYHPVEPLPYIAADLPAAPTSLYWC
ncbi:Tetraspanin-19 like [Actinidia chinensis var. chinensis]|uniref:Tetraspanin-19 like n=1 Tax=Actinidia chinensis var. chinensis TaxID=1590841 RepID=A0A2R6QA53_ACTCC|nr:Tetraspanin-19 like [Actinidia chinensis var. chinensis]